MLRSKKQGVRAVVSLRALAMRQCGRATLPPPARRRTMPDRPLPPARNGRSATVSQPQGPPRPFVPIWSPPSC